MYKSRPFVTADVNSGCSVIERETPRNFGIYAYVAAMEHLNGNECLRAALSIKVLSPFASGPFGKRPSAPPVPYGLLTSW